MKIPEEPWKEISINIIRLLPKLNGKNTIIVIVDQFTKMIHLKATITNISSEEIAKIYQNKIWKLHGVPRAILSDKRASVHIQIYERTYEGIRDQKNVINSISSLNRWTNGMNQSENQHIPMTLCKLSTGQLDKMVSSNRIPIQ